jgi:hypothetical protein
MRPNESHAQSRLAYNAELWLVRFSRQDIVGFETGRLALPAKQSVMSLKHGREGSCLCRSIEQNTSLPYCAPLSSFSSLFSLLPLHNTTMRFSIIPICLTLLGVTTAQLQFSSPKSGVENEFSQTWFEGDTMDIAWYGDWRGTGDGADVVDLWVTWFTNPAFSQLILRMFPLSLNPTLS